MHRRPLLLPAIAIGLGVWAAGQLSAGPVELLAIALLCLDLGRRTHLVPLAFTGWVFVGGAAMALTSPHAQRPLDRWCTGERLWISGHSQTPPTLRTDGSWEVPATLRFPAVGDVVLRGRRSPPPPPGARLSGYARLRHVRSNHLPGQPDRGEIARITGRSRIATTGADLTVSPIHPSPVVRTRRAIRRFLTHRLAPPIDGLALALVIGDRSSLDPDLRDRFTRSGTAHLLAISGLHVGIVALLVGFIVRRSTCHVPFIRDRVSPFACGLIAATCAALAYGSLTGWSISTRRAAAMCAILAVALGTRRRVDGLQVLSTAWCGLLLCDPAALWHPGTALSFGSVLALLRLVPRARESTAAALATPAAATLGTGPVALATFGQLPLGSIPANLLAIPVLGGLAVPLLLVSSAVGLVWPTAGTVLLSAADTVARAGCAVVELAGDPRWAPVLRASPAPGLALAGQLGLLGALTLPRPSHRWIGAIAALGLTILPIRPGSPPSGELALTVLSVGHGDALLLSLPTGEQILVDAGGSPGSYDPGERLVVPALRRLGIRRLHAAAVSHLHVDHYGGMAAVLRSVPTNALWLPVEVEPDHGAWDLVAAARAAGSVVHVLGSEGALPAEIGDVSLATLHPLLDRPCADGSRRCGANDHSMVLRVTLGQVSFLLTGDAEASLEERLVTDGVPLRAQVLKVPHHGSSTSSRPAFTTAVHPVLAIASLDPQAHHRLPRSSVVRRYRGIGATWLATGTHGTIQVSTDGHRLRVRRFRQGEGWSRWSNLPPPAQSGEADD